MGINKRDNPEKLAA